MNFKSILVLLYGMQILILLFFVENTEDTLKVLNLAMGELLVYLSIVMLINRKTLKQLNINIELARSINSSPGLFRTYHEARIFDVADAKGSLVLTVLFTGFTDEGVDLDGIATGKKFTQNVCGILSIKMRGSAWSETLARISMQQQEVGELRQYAVAVNESENDAVFQAESVQVSFQNWAETVKA